MSRNQWPKATCEHRCPKCGKPDRCTIAPEGRSGHCFREGRTWQDNAGGNGQHTDYVGKAHQSKSQPTQPASPERDWKNDVERLHGAMADNRIAALVESTGVPTTAWALLAPGWASADDLRAMRAGGAGWKDNPPDGAWALAEHGGDGRIVGLSLRAVDGRKGSPAGAKRGLIVPTDLHDRPDPVLIVEGASDVAACCALGLAAVGRPSNRAGAADSAIMLDGRTVLVVGERDGKPGGAWPGRDGAKAVAQQIAGRWREPVRWTLPPVDVKDVREWLRVKLAGGLNANDESAMREAGRELLAALVEAAKEAKPEKRSQADALVDLAIGQYRVGMSTDGEAFAVLRERPTVALMFRGGGSALRSALAKSYRATTGKTPSASALADALVALEGMANDTPPEPVALRLAEQGAGVVLDLGDASGRAVVVTPDGWAVEAVSPALFRRTALTSRLPEPVAADASALRELRDLLNVDDDSWPLVVGYLVAALILNIPHPVLMLGGEQGTGKTTAARLIVGLIDPSPAPMRSEPRDAEQWAIAASGSWVVALDNVSHISGWTSDALCKAVTGDGLVRRKLYTDSDLAVLAFRRCIIITSIDPGAMRGDLGDRLLLVDLERIPDEQRRTEAELLAAYEALRPRLLGALLSALSATLSELPNIKLATMPRMADFARVLGALDVGCPELTGGRALALFAGQRQRIAGEVVESDTVAAAVVKFMSEHDEWTGTAGALLTALSPDRPPKGWPANGRALVGRLRRVRPALAAVGIQHCSPAATDKSRIHRLERSGNVPPTPPEPPSNSDLDALAALFGGDNVGGTGIPAAQPPADRPSETCDSDAAELCLRGEGGSGGPLQALSGCRDPGRREAL